MSIPNRIGPGTALAVLMAAFATLAGCVQATVPVAPCCYQGDVERARLSELRFTTEDGHEIPFATVFPDFRPADTLFTRSFPFDKADIRLVPYAKLRKAFEKYDANGDTVIEEPELAVFYLSEAARGLGYPVTGILHGEHTVHALALAGADIDALVRRVEHAKMNADATALFKDLARLGIDLRTRARGGNDDRDRQIYEVK